MIFFAIWSLRYCSDYSGVASFVSQFLSLFYQFFDVYLLGPAIVLICTMICNHIMIPGPAIFSVSSYFCPCKYKCMVISNIVFLTSLPCLNYNAFSPCHISVDLICKRARFKSVHSIQYFFIVPFTNFMHASEWPLLL